VRRLVLIALGCLAWASSAQAASCSNNAVGTFTCVQSATYANTTATPTLAFGSDLTAGTIVLGGVAWSSNSITLNSITASSGCTGMSVTLVDNPTTGTWRGAGFYITGYSSGACTLQFNLSSAVASGAGVEEVSGATATGLQHTVTNFANQGPSAVITTGSITALGADYLFGCYIELANGSQPSAGGTGYTLRDDLGGGTAGRGTEDKSASGSNTASFTTFANAGNYGSVIFIDVAASGGGGAPGCKNGLLTSGAGCDPH